MFVNDVVYCAVMASFVILATTYLLCCTVLCQDYMDNVRGKEVSLLRTTVKIPGQRPRGSEASKPTQQSNGQPANQGRFLPTVGVN